MVRPIESENRPGEQGTHARALTLANDPAGHVMHPLKSISEKVDGPHASQVDLPISETKRPASHVAHVVAEGPDANVPIAHSVHASEEAA